MQWAFATSSVVVESDIPYLNGYSLIGVARLSPEVGGSPTAGAFLLYTQKKGTKENEVCELSPFGEMPAYPTSVQANLLRSTRLCRS